MQSFVRLLQNSLVKQAVHLLWLQARCVLDHNNTKSVRYDFNKRQQKCSNFDLKMHTTSYNDVRQYRRFSTVMKWGMRQCGIWYSTTGQTITAIIQKFVILTTKSRWSKLTTQKYTTVTMRSRWSKLTTQIYITVTTRSRWTKFTAQK